MTEDQYEREDGDWGPVLEIPDVAWERYCSWVRAWKAGDPDATKIAEGLHLPAPEYYHPVGSFRFMGEHGRDFSLTHAPEYVSREYQDQVLPQVFGIEYFEHTNRVLNAISFWEYVEEQGGSYEENYALRRGWRLEAGCATRWDLAAEAAAA